MKKYALLSLTILMLTNTMTLVQATESRDNENLPANLIYSQANQALEGDFLHDRLLTGEIDNALEQGWKNSDAIINAIKKDKRAIELFKKAALQKSNREMFVLSPEKVSIEMVVPNFYKEIILFKLVLIEAEILAKKGRVDDAEENYLAAARFMLHASEEKFQNILTKLFELIYMEVSYPAFTRMANNKYDTTTNFGLKRARIRLKGKVGPIAGFMYQTEVSGTSGAAGFDVRMLEAYINMNFNPWFKLMAGQVMAPVQRQNVTSTAALMAITRPEVAFKNLTWGMTGKSSMVGQSFGDGASGITAPVASRDAGAIIWGAGELATDFHLKYFVGMYDGVQHAGKDSVRFTGRVQLNFLDPEPGFWVKSTYLGAKETIGVGFAYDTQADIAADTATGKKIDYEMITFDLFADLFVTDYNPLTFEFGYTTLDLGGSTTGILGSQTAAQATALTATALGTTPIKQVSGSGMFIQTGILLADRWQPWIMYEDWESDATTGKGGFDELRIGLSYYMKGHNANIKAGYSIFNTDQKIGSTQEDSIGTFIIGAYLFY